MFTSYIGIATNKSDILITLWGINWSDISGSQFLSLLNGLTPSNINFKGTIRLNACSQEEAISIKSIFGSVALTLIMNYISMFQMPYTLMAQVL